MPTISQLPVASAVNSGDLFVIVQGGVTKQAVDSLVLASIQTMIQITESQVTNLTTDLAARLQTFNLIAGTNISLSVSGTNVTINASGPGGFTWNNITGVSATMVSNQGYVANNGALVTLTLPATSSFGDLLDIVGEGAGGWIVAQNAGQNIKIGTSTSTTGVGGSVASTHSTDAMQLVCTVANTTWQLRSGTQSSGLTIV
jgi:hypothetical protein